MALLTFSAGAELDVATGGELDGATKKILKRMDDKPKPIRLTLTAESGGSLGPAIIVVGTPPIGKAWKLQSFTVMGVDSFTTIATGLCSLFLGDPSALNNAQCRIPAQPVPFWNTANGELWAQPGEYVFYLLNTQAAAVTCTGSVSVEEWSMSDVTGTYNRYSGA